MVLESRVARRYIQVGWQQKSTTQYILNYRTLCGNVVLYNFPLVSSVSNECPIMFDRSMAMGACDILSEQVFRIVNTILKTCSDNMSHAPMAIMFANIVKKYLTWKEWNQNSQTSTSVFQRATPASKMHPKAVRYRVYLKNCKSERRQASR
jgi:hypothetical protein